MGWIVHNCLGWKFDSRAIVGSVGRLQDSYSCKQSVDGIGDLTDQYSDCSQSILWLESSALLLSLLLSIWPCLAFTSFAWLTQAMEMAS